MKKYLLTALFMLSLAHLAIASGQQRATPRGEPQALATADYGGYDVFQITFTAAITTVAATSGLNNQSPNAAGVVLGVIFSTGLPGALEFVDLYDSSGTAIDVNNDVMARLYNDGKSTTTAASAGAAFEGFSGTPKPMRFNKGLLAKPSVATFNRITVLYYKEP